MPELAGVRRSDQERDQRTAASGTDGSTDDRQRQFHGAAAIWAFYAIEFWQDASTSRTTRRPRRRSSSERSGGCTELLRTATTRARWTPTSSKFNAVGGSIYTAQTLNLTSANDTNLEILDSNAHDGAGVQQRRAAGDKSSLVTWTAPRSDLFFIRSKRASRRITIYGSYDLLLTTP
jgi:hypothetical protein